MKYAIEYRNMHTAIHGLLLFNSSRAAEKGLKVIAAITDTEDNSGLYDLLFELANNQIEEVNFREMKEKQKMWYSVNNNGHVSPEEDTIKIVNFNSVKPDLYL